MKLFTTIMLSFFLFSSFTSETKMENKVSQETTVLICTGQYSKRYHSYECRGLKSCKATIKKVSLSTAKSNGYTACQICY